MTTVIPGAGTLVDIGSPKKWRDGLLKNVFHLNVGDVVDVPVRDMFGAPERKIVVTLIDDGVREPESKGKERKREMEVRNAFAYQ